ncbi:TPA: hypothetical protein ACGTDK_004696 [Salmonella enterica]
MQVYGASKMSINKGGAQ